LQAGNHAARRRRFTGRIRTSAGIPNFLFFMSDGLRMNQIVFGMAADARQVDPES
jgi:hypothetical protein